MEQNEDKDKKKVGLPPRRGLGRGLGALLSDAPYPDAVPEVPIAPSGEPALPAPAANTTPAASAVYEIPIDAIETNPFQPRSHFDEVALAELADSIRAQGIIQPITVRRMGGDAYQLIAGERRLRASKIAGLTTIPAYIRTANDEQMLEMALIENIQREELNPIETALAYKRLMDECALVIEQVGEKVGKKRPTINNYLRLLKLPSEIQAGLRDQRLSMGHARALISIDNPLIQSDIYKQIIEDGLSVRQTEELVRKLGESKALPPPSQPKAPPTPYEIQLRELESRLSGKYGTRVQIANKTDGKGEIRFQYFSNEELDRLLEQLQ